MHKKVNAELKNLYNHINSVEELDEPCNGDDLDVNMDSDVTNSSSDEEENIENNSDLDL